MEDKLRSRTIAGLFWSFFERIGQQGIQFFISVILARLLIPEQFGLIAMLWIFVSLAQALLDSGFGSALIRKQDATKIDESSVFYFNIIFGVVVTACFYLAAPAIARFYELPDLAKVTRWMSLNLIINSFGVVQTALLTKRVDFLAQMKATTFSAIFSGSIAIVMALKGYGVWSLVAQSLAANISRTLMLWFMSEWRPLLKMSFSSLAEMFPFGSRLLMVSLLNTVFNNIYLLLIGKFFTPADLGYYSRAQNMQQLPVQHILSNTVGRVFFPVFSIIQEDKPRLKRSLSRALSIMALINFPLMIGLAITARPLILVLITERWLPAVPYLQLLCIAGLTYPLLMINLSSIKAQGRSDIYFRLEVINKIMIVIAVLLTYRAGIEAMIYGQIATSVLAWYLNAFYSNKLLNYTVMEQIKDLLPMSAISVAMGAIVFAWSLLDGLSPLVLLMLQIATGISSYYLLCRIFNLSAYHEVIKLVKSGTSNPSN